MKKYSIKSKKIIKPKANLLRSKAKELMLSGENHIKLILAVIIIFASGVVPILISNMVYNYIEAPWADILLIAFEGLLVIPLWLGILRMATLMAKKNTVSVSDLFFAFSSVRAYFKFLLVGVISLILFVLPIILLIFIIGLIMTMEIVGAIELIAQVAVLAFFIALLLPSIWLCCRASLFSALAVNEKGVIKPFFKSIKKTKRKATEIFVSFVGMFPLLIISVLAILLPLVVYTLPYMLCMYAIGAENLIENNE